MSTEKERAQWREYSLRWRNKHPSRWRETRQKYIEAKRALIREAKDKPCVDCNQRFPFYVMDFDHVRGDKKFTIAAHVTEGGFGFEAIVAEIAKCDLVCANCHRIRTYLRL